MLGLEAVHFDLLAHELCGLVFLIASEKSLLVVALSLVNFGKFGLARALRHEVDGFDLNVVVARVVVLVDRIVYGGGRFVSELGRRRTVAGSKGRWGRNVVEDV